MEDHVALAARMEGGATAILTADFLRPQQAPTHGDDRLRIAGSQGIVEVLHEECTLVTHEAAPQVIGRGPTENIAVAREFVATLRGQGRGVFSAAETLRMARALLAARDAADAGKEICLPGK